MNSIRITSGILRGRKISTPGDSTHPMGERERLALFNMISSSIPGADILDAFSGSGSLGIEALSRGASSVVFIERNPKACSIIRKNLQELGLNADVIQKKVTSFDSDVLFDLILADPPYNAFDPKEVEYLSHFLRVGGILVLSHPDKNVTLSNLELIKTRKYAGAFLSIFHKG